MGKLHEYDRNSLTGERDILREVKILLQSTNVADATHDRIQYELNEVEDALKWGFTNQGEIDRP